MPFTTCSCASQAPCCATHACPGKGWGAAGGSWGPGTGGSSELSAALHVRSALKRAQRSALSALGALSAASAARSVALAASPLHGWRRRRSSAPQQQSGLMSPGAKHWNAPPPPRSSGLCRGRPGVLYVAPHGGGLAGGACVGLLCKPTTSSAVQPRRGCRAGGGQQEWLAVRECWPLCGHAPSRAASGELLTCYAWASRRAPPALITHPSRHGAACWRQHRSRVHTAHDSCSAGRCSRSSAGPMPAVPLLRWHVGHTVPLLCSHLPAGGGAGSVASGTHVHPGACGSIAGAQPGPR